MRKITKQTKVHPPEFKQQAVDLSKQLGGTLKEAASGLGVPYKTQLAWPKLDSNVYFHRGLAKAANNEVLGDLSIRLLEELSYPAVREARSAFYRADSTRLGVALENHTLIYQGILEKHRKLALGSLYKHYADVTASTIAEVAWPEAREDDCDE